MLHILGITGPIYIVIALGFVAVRFEVFSRLDMRVLGTYVVKFALPALIFTTLSQRPVRDILEPSYLICYAAGSLAVMFLSFAYGRRMQGKAFSLSVLCGLGMSSSNSGYIGLPIAVQVVGSGAAGVALAMNMLVENFLMIPLALAMADAGSIAAGASRSWHSAARGSLLPLLRNPMILAMIGGVAVASLDLHISGVLARTINMLSLSSAAVSLFVIGGSLVGLTTKGMRRDVLAIALGKLLLHPLAVGLLLWCFPPSDPALRAAGVVFASVPMLSIYPILAQKYGYESFCAAALLLGTVLSFITITVMLWMLGPAVLAWRP